MQRLSHQSIHCAPCSLDPKLFAVVLRGCKQHCIRKKKSILFLILKIHCISLFFFSKKNMIKYTITSTILSIKRLLLKRTWQDRGEHISILTKRLTNLNLNTFACTLSCPMEYSYQLKKRKQFVQANTGF